MQYNPATVPDKAQAGDVAETSPPGGLQSVSTELPEGSATAAALGWEHAAALCKAGQLYECNLASIHATDDSQQVCQQTQKVAMSWFKVHLLKPVTAVAVGEHHR